MSTEIKQDDMPVPSFIKGEYSARQLSMMNYEEAAIVFYTHAENYIAAINFIKKSKHKK